MSGITWTVTHPDTSALPAAAPGAPGVARSGRVTRLATDAIEAAQIRALTTHPDVIALRVERVRSQVDALLWAGIVLGLAFTMVNVQSFAASGSPVGSLAWWVAWLMDPMVSLVLLAVLRAEQVTARYQVPLPEWARRTKWLAFAATYVMNTWTSWGLDGRALAWPGVVLHSVPPLVVFATAETGPGLRDRLTEAVHLALTEHVGAGRHSTAADADPLTTLPTAPVELGHEPVTEMAREPVTGTVHEPAPRPPRRRTAVRGRTNTTARRRLFVDYLAAARVARDQALTDGSAMTPTPAWVRQVTGCSAGTSAKVAAALRADLEPSATAHEEEAA